MNFYVYYLKIEGDDKPFYVGKSFIGSKRFNEHLSRARKGAKRHPRSQKIQKAWREGKRVYEEVVARVATEEEASALEISLIKLHGRKRDGGYLTNLTDGGEGCYGHTVSVDARKRMSEAKKGHKYLVGTKRPDMTVRFSKPISMFTLDGNLVARYPSARAAEKSTGINHKSISESLVGTKKASKDKLTNRYYQFRYGHDLNCIEPVSIRGYKSEQNT